MWFSNFDSGNIEDREADDTEQAASQEESPENMTMILKEGTGIWRVIW
jgi:hypothetical protein